MLRTRLAIALAGGVALAGAALATPAAHAFDTTSHPVTVSPVHTPALTPFNDGGCLLDDPTSCAPETPTHPTPPHGGGNQGDPIGADSYCDGYRDALGDMANTPFGMKQLAELGC
jgi:hypothetical protein